MYGPQFGRLVRLSQKRVNVQIDPGAILPRRSIQGTPVSTPPGRNACGATVIARNTACPPRRALAFVGRDARAPPWTSLPLSRQPSAVSDHHGRLSYDEPRRLRASAAVHDHRETPSAIPLKPASAIAEIRTKWVGRPRRKSATGPGIWYSAKRTVTNFADPANTCSWHSWSSEVIVQPTVSGSNQLLTAF